MKKQWLARTVIASAALAMTLSGFAGTVSAAYDDMDAVSLTKKFIGEEYTKGAESPKYGFDAAGLIYYVFEEIGYDIPRTLAEQFRMDKGTKISSTSSLDQGDLVFFGSPGKPTYGGIYIGSGKFVMASKSRDEVVTRYISDYKDSFIGARRVLSKNDRLRIDLVLKARQYLGTPYKFGAKFGQTKTFDCSSFMKWIYSRYDIELPRVSRDQAKAGKYVSKSDLKVGDLVFFTTPRTGKKIGHVGMYVGNGQMIHTYGEGGVKYESITNGWWKDHYVTARRVIN
jgi:peptidoglycan DL-endopeptidase LytE